MAVRGGVQIGAASGTSMSTFFFARRELGGPSVAVRGGVHVGAASGTSMSLFSPHASLTLLFLRLCAICIGSIIRLSLKETAQRLPPRGLFHLECEGM